MSTPPVDAIERDQGAIPPVDPIEAAEGVGELVADQVRELITAIASSGEARFTAMGGVLEATDRVVAVLEEATRRGREGRAHVLALVELLVRTLDRVAPVAVHALVDEEPRVRHAAARAILAFTTVPSVARTARRAAEHHPDPMVREALPPVR